MTARDGDLQRYADESRIRTRAEQGLGPVIDDPVTAARLADLAGDWWRGMYAARETGTAA